MTRSLLVLGCGGHGRVVADAAMECGYDEIAFLDDSFRAGDVGRDGLLGPLAMMETLSGAWPEAIAAVGNGTVRLDLFRALKRLRFVVPNIVHPSAVVSRRASLGDGVFVGAGAVINIGAVIKDAAIINTGARVDHDCSIGAGSHIAPGATLSGNVETGERAWLGTGCSVKQGVTIGDGAVVGVGAAVVSDLAAGETYIGVPARPLEKRQ